MQPIIQAFMEIKDQNSDFEQYDRDSIEYSVKKQLRTTAKTLLNSQYGKTAEKPKHGAKCWCDKRQMFIDAEQYHEETGEVYKEGLAFDVCNGKYVPETGKVMLLRAIKSIIDAGGKFLYADTDSVFAVIKSAEMLKGMNISNELGAWKFEIFFDKFKYNGKVKKYMCE